MRIVRDRTRKVTRSGAWRVFVFFLPLTLLCLTPVQSQVPLRTGTAIITLKTPDSIVVAADSRETSLKNGVPYVSSDVVCKVVEHEGFLFGLANLANFPNGRAATDVAMDVIQASSTVFAMRNLFAQLAQSALERDEAYRYAFPFPLQDGFAVMQFFFAGVEDGRPVLASSDLKVQETAARRGLMAEHGVEFWSSPALALFLGRATSLVGKPTTTLEMRASTALAVSRLPQLIADIAAMPEHSLHVGGRTDVVTIGPDGIAWPLGKPTCGGR